MSKKEKKCNILSCILCSCFTNSNDNEDVNFETVNENEPFGYFVEKLCIKKLPLRAFTTAENVDQYNKKLIVKVTDLPSKASKMTRQDQIPAQSNITFHKHLGASFSPFSYKLSPMAQHIPSKESELVSNILNKHASLYTLDEKTLVPKDPLNPPKNKVVVPDAIKATIRGSQDTPVEVVYKPNRRSSSKRRMTPDIEKTINALKMAPKSQVKPKNQTSISVIPLKTNHTMRKEFSSLNSSETSLSPDTNDSVQVQSYDPESTLGTVDLETSSSTNNKHSTDSLEIDEQRPSQVQNKERSKPQNLSYPKLSYQNLKWKIIIKHHSDKSHFAPKVGDINADRNLHG